MFAAMGLGILLSFAVLIVMARINLKKFMGYPAVLDASVVLLFGLFLHGTLGGMAAAIAGGLFFSLMITVIRKYYGYARFDTSRREWVVTEGLIQQAMRTKNPSYTGERIVGLAPLEGIKSCLNLKSLKGWHIFIVLLFLLVFTA